MLHKVITILLICCLSIAMVGCEDNYQPTEGNSSYITIVRCGNKPTVSITEPNGKTTQTTVLIDDIGEIPVESK